MATLTPLAKKVIEFSERQGGSFTSREAFLDLDITSSSLTRRITEIERSGKYEVSRVRKTNPHTEQQYTEYGIKEKEYA